MALVRTFEAGSIARPTLHDEIPAAVSSFTIEGRKIIQIDTFGRDIRENLGKKSQTIQLDEDGARILFELLKREFGFN